jgi:tetratricopeptide (TPR) repeat protein
MIVACSKRPSFVACALCLGLLAGCTKNPDRVKREAVVSGDRYYAQGKYSEAIIEYRTAIQSDPRFGEARLKLGHAYLAIDDGANAYREIVRAADLMPEDVDAQREAGQMALRASQYDDARQRALRVLKRQPKDVDAQILLGNALAGLKDIAGAISQVEQAIDADPTRTLTYANLGMLQYAAGNSVAAESAFKRAIAAAPRSEVAHLALANFYWATSKFAEAETELKTAIDMNAQSPLVQLAASAFFLSSNRPAEAESSLKTYVKLSNDLGAKLTLADLYLTLKRPGDARQLLEQIATQSDGFVPATLRMASLEYSAGHVEQGHKLLADAQRREPRNPDAHLLAARMLLKEKKYSAALGEAKAVTASNPKSVAGWYFEGLASEQLGSTDTALAAFQEVLRLNPKALPAQVGLARVNLSVGNAAAAAQFATEAAKAQPQFAPAHLLVAKAYANLGRVDAAIAELLPLEKSAPSVDVFASLGQLYVYKRDFARARQAFGRAGALNPNSLEVLGGLTAADLSEHKPAEAKSRIARRLAATPNDAGVHFIAATTFATLAENASAETAFKRVLELDPNNLDAYGGLARVYVSDRRLDEAKREFEELAKRQPKPVAAKTMVGMILELQNRPADARTIYEQVLLIDSEAAIASNNLAVVYAEKGENLDVALRLAQTAKSKMPNRHEVDDTLGWVYYKKGLYSLAIAPLKQSAAAAPENPLYQYHLGLAYAQNGDRDKARQTLRRALELKGDFDGADEARKVLKSLAG